MRYLYQKLISDRHRLDWFLDSVVTREWHYQHDAGRPFEETSAELIRRFPEERELIAAYGPRWLETIGEPIPGMIELVGEIAAAGIPLYGITNFSGEFWRLFRPTAPVFDLFEDIVVSGVEKLTKPDAAIYVLAQQRFGVDPGRTLFIDDQPRNVVAAEAAGFLAHRFDGRAGVEARLIELGLFSEAAEAASGRVTL
ncbi:HAD-IA family hydrolase [Pacificimonas flava]|uniref:HAD-IA family hydrolase n=1 Tax=Pacificimonas flava TaxID=1234595 RepID=UPI0030B8CC8C